MPDARADTQKAITMSNGQMFLSLPAAGTPTCVRCRRPIVKTQPIGGYGPECARLVGLINRPQPRSRPQQTGPDLFTPDTEGDPVDDPDRDQDCSTRLA